MTEFALDPFFELSSSPMVITAADGTFKRANPAMERLLGWTEAELLARPCVEFQHPDDRAATADARQLLNEDRGSLANFENRYLAKDGSYRWLSWRVMPHGELRYGYIEDVTARMTASERSLAHARELNRRIVDHAPMAIAYLDRSLIYNWINPAHSALTGIPMLNIAGKSLEEAYGPERAERIAPLLRGVLATGEPLQLASVPFTRVEDGESLTSYWDATYQPVVEAGEVIGVMSLAIEVSARVEKERLQAASLAALASENTRIESQVDERTKSLQAANEELGAQQEELQAINEELRQQTEQLLALSNELRRQQRFAETLLDRLPGGVAYLDKDFVFRVANTALANFYGLPLDRILGRRVQEARPGRGEEAGAMYAQVRETLKPVEFFGLPIKAERDGQPATQYWDAVISPFLDEEGAFDGWLVLAFEVSERILAQADLDNQRARQAEQVIAEQLLAQRVRTLEEAEAHKDQFLGILSHELRTPINAITGFSSVLEDGLVGELTNLQKSMIAKILDASDRLLLLVDDLLDMSRLQAGKFSVAPEPLALSAVVAQAIASTGPRAQAKKQALEAQIPSDLPSVLADPKRLGQVLDNMLTNASKYTPEGGRLAVSANVAGEWVRVTVADNGIGIPETELGRIFQPFTQVDMSNTRASSGVGLGLSIVKALVEAQGGEIGVESRLNVGSTFWFTLPLAK